LSFMEPFCCELVVILMNLWTCCWTCWWICEHVNLVILLYGCDVAMNFGDLQCFFIIFSCWIS
jgi:hypothetical protein